jgi:hypothetical protein
VDVPCFSVGAADFEFEDEACLGTSNKNILANESNSIIAPTKVTETIKLSGSPWFNANAIAVIPTDNRETAFKIIFELTYENNM